MSLNFMKPEDSGYIEQHYLPKTEYEAAEAAGELDYLSISALRGKLGNTGNYVTVLDANYFGEDDITVANYKYFPKGSRIWCPNMSTPTLYLKTAEAGTSTWKSTTFS